jgi:holo-[acyl-carrier protein] synthase
MIKGVGVDLVDVQRFADHIAKTPGLAERLLTEPERVGAPNSLAGRFAAKEAFIKAVGNAAGMNWREVEVTYDAAGRPSLLVSGATQTIVEAAGIERFHLSISHDGGFAIAYVIAEGGAA